MDRITLENYRCFREKQTARLAPLTLLVGNNSTGKTSFLALIRALWDAAFRNEAPDFREEPYDLGTFATLRTTAVAEVDKPILLLRDFSYQESTLSSEATEEVNFHLEFEEWNARPFPVLQGFVRRGALFAVQEARGWKSSIHL